MPRSKSKRSSAKPDASLIPPENLKKCYSILEDFDRQVEARIKAAYVEMESVASKIRTATELRLLQIPKDLRNMKLTEFEELLRTNVENDSKDTIEEEGSKMLPPPSMAKKRTRARKTNNKENSSVSSTSSLETSRLRRSTRNRPSRSVNTPANPTSFKSTVAATPMTIKTKFDVGTPLTKSICRVAKPNETLVSLTGSPVIVPSGISKTLKEENTLEEVSRDELLEIRSRINNVLSKK